MTDNDDFLRSITNDLSELEGMVDPQNDGPSNEFNMDSILSELGSNDIIGNDDDDDNDDFFNMTRESLSLGRKDEMSISKIMSNTSINDDDVTVIKDTDGKLYDDLTPTPTITDDSDFDGELSTSKSLHSSLRVETNFNEFGQNSLEVKELWDQLEHKEEVVVDKNYSTITSVIPTQETKGDPTVMDKINTGISYLFTSISSLKQQGTNTFTQQKSQEQKDDKKENTQQKQPVKTTIKCDSSNETTNVQLSRTSIHVDPLCQNEVTNEKEQQIHVKQRKPVFVPPTTSHEITPYQKQLTADGYLYILSHSQFLDVISKQFTLPGLIIHDIILRYLPDQKQFVLTKGSKSDFDILPDHFEKETLLEVFALSPNFYIVYIEQYDEYYLAPNSPIVIPNAKMRYIAYSGLSNLTTFATHFDSVTSYLSSVDKKMGDTIIGWAKSWF
ncbi:Uncharacterized protein QTN25_005801 [Entamoeba marina]